MFTKNGESTETLRNESNTLTNQMESLAKTIGEKGEKVSSDVADKLGKEVDHYRKLVTETMHKAYEAGSAGFEQVGEQVRRKPLVSMLAAFGVGCAISWLFRK